MTKPLIGVDIDDTVVEFMLSLCAFRARAYGDTLQRHHFTTFRLYDVWGCSVDEALRRIEEFYGAPEHALIPAVAGAVEGLSVLAKTYEIHGITARPAHTEALTAALVERHAPGLLSGLHLLGHQRSKGDFCQELGVGLLIDDALHNARSVGDKGIAVLLLDRPWNQGVLPANTTRTMHWREIPDLVRRVTAAPPPH